ncbi:MAG: tetratricopeptide repeat protein [Bacteroidetes bacterium]|nr:tetratricopeptide repeat protein [Bacteroidota bacterium]
MFNPHEEEEEARDIQELMQRYQNLKYGRANAYIEEDDFEKIIEHLDDKDEITEAIEAANLALNQYPFSALLMIKKADLLLATRKYKEALTLLDTAALYDHKDMNLFILKTDAYLALDQPAEAIVLLQEALHLFEGQERTELLFELADVYDDHEAFDKVFDCLQLVLEEDPSNEEALYKICFWTDFTGRNEESIRLHQHLIDEQPYNALAWFNLAAAYQGLKLHEKAIDAYQFAIVIDEKFDYAYRNMGDAYLRLRKYKEAIEALEKVLELSRPEDVIYEAIGHCYHRMKNYAQARFHYKKAVHLNSEDSRLFQKMAITYMLEEKWEMAIKQLEHAIRIHKHINEYFILMGECYMHMDQNKEAAFYFGTVVKNKPKQIAGWEYLIKCLISSQQLDMALEQTELAYISTQGKILFIYYRSAILFMMKKPADGLLQLEMALSKSTKWLKKFMKIYPEITQDQKVIDIISKYKKGKIS